MENYKKEIISKLCHLLKRWVHESDELLIDILILCVCQLDGTTILFTLQC